MIKITKYYDAYIDKSYGAYKDIDGDWVEYRKQDETPVAAPVSEKVEDIHKKSLEALDRYLSNTPKEEIEALIKKYSNLNIEGPTVDEYFNSIGFIPAAPVIEGVEKLIEAAKELLTWNAHLPQAANYEIIRVQQAIADLESLTK